MDLTRHAGPRGGKRLAQIGADAVLGVLDASLDHCENSLDAWLMSFLNVGVGHELPFSSCSHVFCLPSA